MKDLEKNIFLALYDGWALKEGCTDRYVKRVPLSNKWVVLKPERFKYTTSYDWIIPVIKKLNINAGARSAIFDNLSISSISDKTIEIIKKHT